MVHHFQDFLSEPEMDKDQEMLEIICNIPKLGSQYHNISLMRPINSQEVEYEVRGMPSRKSPGPDGFTIDFFQHC